MNNTIKQLEQMFSEKIKVTQISPQKFRIWLPFYKLEGRDVYEIYLVADKNKGFYLSDGANTMKSLDKIFELGEKDVQKNIASILKQYDYQLFGNEITIACNSKNIHIKAGFLVQAASFLLNMKIFYI